jgi:prepilin-type N-terminal cleavage/methylation domain-containing protein
MLRIGNRAFTFIELMITVAILSIGLVLILQAFSASVKASGLSRDITRACFLAESKISELEVRQEKGIEIPSQDQAEVDRFIWDYEITPLKDPALSILKFNVSNKKPKREEILEIVTYLKKPQG